MTVQSTNNETTRKLRIQTQVEASSTATHNCTDKLIAPIQLTRSKSCGNYLVQPRIDKSIDKIKSFEIGGKKEAQLINAIAFIITKDNLSLNIVDKEDFTYFYKVAYPFFKLPGRKQITNVIESKYEILSTIIKQRISVCNNITITANVWTQTMFTASFLDLTVHFLYNEGLDFVTMEIFKLNERYTSEYLSAKMKMICDDWLIDLSKIHVVVTDNAANIIAAVKDLFGKNKQLSCFAHTVNLVPVKLCKKVLDIKEIIDKVKAIVTFLKHSVIAADKFRNVQNLNASNPTLKLIQVVPTR